MPTVGFPHTLRAVVLFPAISVNIPLLCLPCITLMSKPGRTPSQCASLWESLSKSTGKSAVKSLDIPERFNYSQRNIKFAGNSFTKTLFKETAWTEKSRKQTKKQPERLWRKHFLVCLVNWIRGNKNSVIEGSGEEPTGLSVWKTSKLEIAEQKGRETVQFRMARSIVQLLRMWY